MKIFLKGFCIGLLCLSLLGLLWFLVLQPGLTNGEAQALKKEYAQPLPGAESSGVLPAGKEQLEPESLVDLPALQAEYPDIKGWISIPGTVWITRFCKAAPMIPNTICGVPTRENGALPEASFSMGLFRREPKYRGLRAQHE